MSKWIKNIECPECGHEKSLGVYDDHEHCFHPDCGYHMNYNDNYKGDAVETVLEKPEKKLLPLPAKNMPALKKRNLSAATVNKYKVSVPREDAETDIEVVYPRFDSDGNHIANQIRLKNKDFRCEGKINAAAPFGHELFPAGGKSITVTEGYYDAMSAFELTGSRYPNVGVMSASTAKKEIATWFEYYNSFGEVIINFDSDEPGQKAAKECASLFAPGKVRILKLEREKDASDYLQKGLIKEYINEWFRAPVFMPDGLRLGSELWEDIRNHKIPFSIPYPWNGMNDKTYGMRLSEFTLLLADTGVGKTSVCKEIETAILKSQELIDLGYGIGLLHLEEPKYDTAIGLMSIHANKRFHLPDVEKTEEELKEAFDATVNTNRLVIWDHFGSNDIDVVLSKIRHMAALGCKYVVVDHLSIIVSDQSGDERKQLDEISTKLKTLTMNLNIHVIAVIHTNRQGEVRGSAGPEKVANTIIRLERNKKDINEWRRNVTRLVIEKNRFAGRTGPACWLFFNEMTGRLEEMDRTLIDEYENGGSGAGHEFETYAA